MNRLNKPLQLYDSVYVVTKNKLGVAVVQRCFVTALHDDKVQVLSLECEAIFWIDRDKVVTRDRARAILS
jgi:hypothetical protein